MQLSKQSIFTLIYQYGVVFHLGGKRFSVVLCGCITWSFDIQALSGGQPFFSHYEKYVTVCSPLYCQPSRQENHNHTFATVHERCKHKNIMEKNISVQ